MPSISRGRVLALDVQLERAGLLRSHNGCIASIARRYCVSWPCALGCCCCLYPCTVVAMGALVPLHADVVLVGLVRRDLAVPLRLVVAMRALLPLNADAVLVGLVRHDAAVRLGPVLAALVVTEPPAHINIVHVGSVHLEVAIQLRLVLATKLSASMPSYADAVHVGSVHLVMWISCFVLYSHPSSRQSCHTISMAWGVKEERKGGGAKGGGGGLQLGMNVKRLLCSQFSRYVSICNLSSNLSSDALRSLRCVHTLLGRTNNEYVGATTRPRQIARSC